ncbi:MAG: hypothetical protein WC762_11795 [Methylobacter sp.]|jgi:predicted MFS family arabinose efflux permease
MANLKVNAKITAPENIDIPLVRADIMHMSSTFRVCFEVGLSLTSTLAGYVLSLQEALPIHWVFLAVSVLATGAFLVLSVRKQHEAAVQS